MSANIVDSKVVELSLENQSFESNADKSLSTLDKLKQALQFDKSSDGLDRVSESALKSHGVVGTLTAGVNTLKGMLGSAMKISLFASIADEAIQAKNHVKELITEMSALGQASAGWDKYALKSESVHTIMSATAKDWNDQGKQMEFVNDQLEKLNWFTDETSFDFVDMVNNIGKFTNNNVKLDDAVTAMEGISTWAGLSGANIGEASRAMYNLSQAIAVGSVKLMDWKSIENANMATTEFKQTAIDTAVELGALTKVSDNLYKTLEGHEVSATNFNENLKDEWFSSEVLMGTLNKFGSFTTRLSEVMDDIDTSITTSKVVEYIDQFKEGSINFGEAAKAMGMSVPEAKAVITELGDEMYNLGFKAFKASQEAITFEQAIDSVKDAVSTGWMNTFEIIFGDYLNAKDLWTDFANDLYDIFAEGGNARNELLEEAFSEADSINQSDWDKLTKSGLASPEYVSNVLKAAEEHGRVIRDMGSDELTLQHAISEGIIKMSDLWGGYYDSLPIPQVNEELLSNVESLKENDEAFGELLSTIEEFSGEDIGSIIFGNGEVENEELESALDSMLKSLGLSQDKGMELVNVLKEMGYFGGLSAEMFSGMSDEQLASIGWTEEQIASFRKAEEEGENLQKVLADILSAGEYSTGTEYWTDGLYDSMEALKNVIEIVKESWHNVFPEATADDARNLLRTFAEFAEKVKDFTAENEQLETVLTGVFSVLNVVVNGIVGLGKGAFNIITGIIDGLGINIGEILVNASNAAIKFKDWANGINLFNRIASIAGGTAKMLSGFIRDLIDRFLNLPAVSQNIKRFKAAFSQVFGTLGPFIDGAISAISKFLKHVNIMGGLRLDNIGLVFKDFKSTVLDYFAKFPGFKAVSTAFKLMISDVKSGLGKAINIAGNYIKDLRAKLEGTFAGKVLGFVVDTFTKIKEAIGKFTSNLSLTLGGGIGATFSNLGESIKAKATAFWIGLQRVFQGTPVKGVLEKIQNVFTKLFSGLGNISFENIFETIRNAFTDFISSIPNLFNSNFSAGDLFSSIISTIKKPFEAIIEFFIGSKDKIRENASKMIDKISIFDGFKKILGGFGDAVVFVAKNLLTLVKSFAGLAIAFMSLRTLQNISSAFKSIASFKAEQTSTKILKFAAAIGILAASVWVISTIPKDRLWASVGAVAGLAIVLAGLQIAISKLGNPEALDKAGYGMASIAASVLILVGALKLMETLNKETLKRNLEILAGLLVGLTIVSIALGKLGGSSGLSSGLGVLAIAASLYIIMDVLKRLETFEIDNVLNVLKSFGICLLAIAAVMLTTRLAGENALGAAASIAAIGVSFLLLAGAIKILETVDKENIGNVVLLMAAMTVMLVAVVAVSKLAQGSAASIVVLGVVIALLAVSLAGLSLLDQSALQSATICFGAMIAMLSVLMLVTGLLHPSALALLGLTTVMLSIAAVFYVMRDIPVETMMAITESLQKVMTSFTILMGVLGLIGLAGPAALFGVGAAIALVGGIGLLFASFGEAMGQGISSFITEITGSLPQVGADLSAFAEAVQPFVEASRGMDESDFAGVSALAGAIIDIASGEFVVALEKLFGVDPITEFVNQLPELARGLNAYADELDDSMDASKVEASANAVALLGSVVANDIQPGGIVGWLTGSGNNITQFAEQLKPLAVALKDYTNEINTTDFNAEKQEASKTLIEMLADLAKNDIPDGGIIGWLTGSSNNITQFAEQLPGLASSLANYTRVINASDFNPLKIVISNMMATLLANLASHSIPDGGIIGWLTGSSSNITQFAEQLPALGEALSNYSNSINSTAFNKDKLDASGRLAEMIADLANAKIPTGGIVGMLQGTNSQILNFAGQLPALAEGLSDYATTINATTFNPIKLVASKVLTEMLSDLANSSIPEGTTGLMGWITGKSGDIENFGKQLPKLAEGISGYAANLTEDIDAGKIEASANAIQLLSTISASLSEVNLGEGSYGIEGDLEKFGKSLSSFAVNLSEFTETEVDVTKLSAMAEASKWLVTAAVRSKDAKFEGDIMDEEIVSSFGKNLSALVESINAATVNTSGVDDVLSAVEKIGSADVSKASFQLSRMNDTVANSAPTGEDITNSVTEGIDSSAIAGATQSAIDSAMSSIDVSSFSLVGMNILEALVSALSHSNSVSIAIKAVIDSARNSVDTSQFVSAGMAIPSGLAVGIVMSTFLAVASARAMAQAAKDAINAVFNSHSPSRETMKIGKWVVQGLAIGMENNARIAVDASKSMSRQVLDELKAATSGIYDVLTSEIDGDPVIRPVLDLTEIQNGANDLAGMLNMSVPVPVTGSLGVINANANGYVRTTNDDIVAALSDLKGALGGGRGDTYIVDGITYDDGSNITDAVRSLVRAAKVGRRT